MLARRYAANWFALALGAAGAAFTQVALLVVLFIGSREAALAVAAFTAALTLLVVAAVSRGHEIAGGAVRAVLAGAAAVALGLIVRPSGIALSSFVVPFAIGVGAAVALRDEGAHKLVARLIAVPLSLASAAALFDLADRFATAEGEWLVLAIAPFIGVALADPVADALLARRPFVAVAIVAAVLAAAAGTVAAIEALEQRRERAFRESLRPPPPRVGQERIVWQRVVGRGFVTGPLVADGVVFADVIDHVQALDARSGRPLWRARIRGRDGLNPPVVRDGVFYYAAHATGVFAYAVRSGRLLWRRRSERRGQFSSPMFAGGTLVYTEDSGHVHGVDPRTGRERWRFRPRKSGHFAYSDADAGHVFVTVYMDSPYMRLYALGARTGRVEWQRDFNRDVVYVEAEGTRLFAATESQQYVFAAATGARLARKRIGAGWLIPDRVMYTFGSEEPLRAREARSGRVLWTYPRDSSGATSAPVTDGRTVYVTFLPHEPKTLGGLHALDARTGRLRWKVELRGVGNYPPGVAGRLAYVAGAAACPDVEDCPGAIYAIRRD